MNTVCFETSIGLSSNIELPSSDIVDRKRHLRGFVWVKTGKTPYEQMNSVISPTSDIRQAHWPPRESPELHMMIRSVLAFRPLWSSASAKPAGMHHPKLRDH